MHPLIPLLIIIILILVAAVVGFVIYTIATDIASKTSKKIEDHNVSFGKDGMKISVKEKRHEDYVNETQNVLVKAWNLSSWPAYKSRFWNKDAAAGGSSSRSGRSSSSSSARKTGPSPSPHRSPSSSGQSHRGASTSHTHRTENGRLAEPRPSVRRSASSGSVPGSFD